MSDIICVNARKAAMIMLESGLTTEQAQKGIDTIKQPSKGYYKPCDIYAYINTIEHTYYMEGQEDREGDILFTLTVYSDDKEIFCQTSYDFDYLQSVVNRKFPYALEG